MNVAHAQNLLLKNLASAIMRKNPTLDLWGTDRKVLQISYQDLLNYLKVHWELIGLKDADLELYQKILDYLHDPEFEEFIYFWAGLWLEKWNKRVKLVLGSRDLQRWRKIDDLLKEAEPVWRKIEYRNEMKNLVIDSLIRNGEICGTSILATSMLKIEMGLRAKRKIPIQNREQILNLVNRVLKKAKNASRSKGPLIYIRIGKWFFRILQKQVK
jgi:hypothetical protein